MPALPPLSSLAPLFVPETRIGFWFLGTNTWVEKVIRVAVKDLLALIDLLQARYHTQVGVGCGQGLSFRVLQGNFKPQRLIGVEFDPKTIDVARARVLRENLPVDRVRLAGFRVTDSRPYLGWSRADLGIAQNIFKIKAPPFGQREETLVHFVAYKPLQQAA